MSQFAGHIQASESLKFVMFAGALYTFGQPFVDMLGVFRYTEHFYARIIDLLQVQEVIKFRMVT